MQLHGLVTIDEFFEKVEIDLDFDLIQTKKGANYINKAASFDIEVSSFTYDNKKQSLMYIWMFGLDGYVVIGRTWDEFISFINRLTNKYFICEDIVLPVYVHNLSYEFQFIKDMFNWVSIFAREKRSPMKALADNGIEFRCSYMLSGCSLDMTAKSLTKHNVKKMVGDLDYELIRTPNTELTDLEMGYCINDVLVVMALIDEEIDTYGDVTKIPMTNTGKVRQYCREHTIFAKRNKEYNKMIKSLTIGGSDEYEMLKRAFQGGFTHANYNKVGFVYDNVQSFDFTSSYPTVMCAEKNFPMSKGEFINVETLDDIEELSNEYCLIFNIEFSEIVSRVDFEHYLSYSKCFEIEEPVLDNGRVISAKRLRTTITEIDLDIILECYAYDDYKIGKCIAYKKGYLPKEFVQCVLDFYEDKTTLKDVEGQEKEYTLKKGMLNSCYGMTVTDIINDEIIFENEWDSIPADVEECIEAYNNSKNRFLFYPWGVYVTALARHNLWRGILECKDDYIYSDTDSIKITNAENHMDFIREYNDEIIFKLKKACYVLGIKEDKICPKTVKGKEKPLGVWDDDGLYDHFKTLGAKRYLVEADGHIKCTIAGVNKKKTSEWLSEQADPFETFNDFMTVDADHSGRMIVSYIDKPMDGVVTDYKGNKYEYHELSGINMTKGEYNLTMSPLYLILLRGRQVNML